MLWEPAFEDIFRFLEHPALNRLEDWGACFLDIYMMQKDRVEEEL